MRYGFFANVAGSFDVVQQRVTEELKKEGFGILSEIDVQKAMKEKLGIEIPAQRILGACNPALAYQALQAEPNVGLLLPCNVTVRQEENGTVLVGFLDPDMIEELTHNPSMHTMAREASARLHRVADQLNSL